MYPNDMDPNEEERLEKLPGDYDNPAAPAQDAATTDDIKTPLSVDDPRKDTDVDLAEAYDVGMDGASASPSQPGSVIGYDPAVTADDSDDTLKNDDNS